MPENKTVIEPLIKTVVVPCTKEDAFDTFVNRMETWWPLGKFTHSAMRGAPAKGIRVETSVGGKIVEIESDDNEIEWGEFVAYDPYDYISMRFHIPAPNYDIPGRSLVELRFTAIEDKLTSVELKQSDWEAFGEAAKMLIGGYGPGWSMIFEGAYKTACGG